MSNKLPPHIQDFFNKAAPKKSPSPVEELQDRFLDRINEAKRGGAPSFSHSSDIDYIVEFRIREWMMRQQKEADDERRLKEFRARMNRPHDKTPPKGPNNSAPPC